MKFRCGVVAVMIMTPLPMALIAQTPEPTASLLVRFDNEHDYPAKERLLLTLTSQDAGAGPALLQLAQSTAHVDTRWLAMRGMATLHYAACAPFLEASLKDADALVRANAARALSDLRITDAAGPLLAMFAIELDHAAIEQSSLTLRVLGIKAAAPYIREKIPMFTGQTRDWLIQALGFLGDARDVPMLAAQLDQMECDTVVSDTIGELAGVTFGPPRPPLGGISGCPPPEMLAARAWWKSHKDTWPRCDDCHPPVTRVH